MAAAATAAGIASLQQIESLSLATEVGVASLRQVPGAIHHVLALRKADLVQIVCRRPSRREAIQPVAPATSPALLAVLGWIPRSRSWRTLDHGRAWPLLFLPGMDDLLLMLDRWVYFLLFNGDLGRGLLFLQGYGFLRGRKAHSAFYRLGGSGPLFLLDKQLFWRCRGLHFLLSLKERVTQRSFKVVTHSESPCLRWGRRCCIANFMKVQEEALWLHLSRL